MRRISSLGRTMKRRNYLWRLHPPPPSKEASSSIKESNTKVSNSKFNFNLHDNVYIRPKSTKEFGISGRIVDIISSISSSSETFAKDGNINKKRRLEDVRVSIQQSHNGNTKVGVRPSRLFPIYESKDETLIIITPDTTNYRQLATSHLRVSDKVLEIGCSTGECTALVLRRLMLLHKNNNLKQEQKNDVQNGSICAFDIGSDMVEQASSRVRSEFDALQAADLQMPSYTDMIQFHKVDALSDPKRAYTHATTDTTSSTNNQSKAPNIILIDIGGNRELKGVVQMINWVQSAFCQNDNDSVRVIIVKSESLAEALTKSTQSTIEEEEKKIEADSSTVQQQLTVMDNGIINQGQEWFTSLLSSFSTNTTSSTVATNHQRRAPTYNHPLKAPLVLSPKDDKTAICRFHNYDIDGCKNGTRCPYDHEHCHWCREVGHTALNCHHFK